MNKDFQIIKVGILIACWEGRASRTPAKYAQIENNNSSGSLSRILHKINKDNQMVLMCENDY